MAFCALGSVTLQSDSKLDPDTQVPFDNTLTVEELGYKSSLLHQANAMQCHIAPEMQQLKMHRHQMSSFVVVPSFFRDQRCT